MDEAIITIHRLETSNIIEPPERAIANLPSVNQETVKYANAYIRYLTLEHNEPCRVATRKIQSTENRDYWLDHELFHDVRCKLVSYSQTL